MGNWTKKELAVIKDMAISGTPNVNIAAALRKDITAIHAKRSELGITKDKVAAMKLTACSCCGTACVDDIEHEYIMPDGSDAVLCERCRLTVDYVNSFDNASDGKAKDEADELVDDDGEQTDY